MRRVGLKERGEQHASSREVDGCTFEVHLEVLVDGCEAESIADA